MGAVSGQSLCSLIRICDVLDSDWSLSMHCVSGPPSQMGKMLNIQLRSHPGDISSSISEVADGKAAKSIFQHFSVVLYRGWSLS